MKQKTYCANTREEVSAALSDIAASREYREAACVLVRILPDLFSQAEAADLLETVKEALPRAKTVGVSVVEW